MVRRFIVLLLLFFVSAGFDEVFAFEAYSGQEKVNLSNKNHREGELDPSHLQILEFGVGVSTMDDIKDKLGAAEMFRSSVEEHSSVRMCYKSNNKKDNTIILFDAGALGGWKTITSYTIKEPLGGDNFADISKCKGSSLVYKDISTSSGLKLGLSKNQIKAILGLPTKEEKDLLLYKYYLPRKPMTEKEIEKLQHKLPGVREYPYYQVISGAEARFVHNKLVSLEIYKVEVY